MYQLPRASLEKGTYGLARITSFGLARKPRHLYERALRLRRALQPPAKYSLRPAVEYSSVKALYVISIIDKKGAHISLGVIATGLAQAIAAAQKQAETDADPLSFQKLHSVDIDATV